MRASTHTLKCCRGYLCARERGNDYVSLKGDIRVIVTVDTPPEPFAPIYSWQLHAGPVNLTPLYSSPDEVNLGDLYFEGVLEDGSCIFGEVYLAAQKKGDDSFRGLGIGPLKLAGTELQLLS